jgi:hypothetical protein
VRNTRVRRRLLVSRRLLVEVPARLQQFVMARRSYSLFLFASKQMVCILKYPEAWASVRRAELNLDRNADRLGVPRHRICDAAVETRQCRNFGPNSPTESVFLLLKWQMKSATNEVSRFV